MKKVNVVSLVLVALLVLGGIGYGLWSATERRIQRERVVDNTVVQRGAIEDFPKAAHKPKPLTAKQKRQVEYSKKQYQKRLAAWKRAGSKKNEMPLPNIPKGTTGQAQVNENYGNTSEGYVGKWSLSTNGVTVATDVSANNASVDTNGQVSIPSDDVADPDFPTGQYSGVYYKLHPDGVGYRVILVEFIVPNFSVNLTNVDVNTCAGGVSCDATAMGGTDPIEMRFLIDNVEELGWTAGRNQSFSKGNGIAAGSHTLKVEARDSSDPQLTASDSESFNMPALLENEVVGSPNPAQAGGTVEFTSLPTGGTPPYFYEWPDGESTASVIYDAGPTAGFLEASCIVTDSEGCTAEATGFVTVESDGSSGGGGGGGGTPPEAPADGDGHPPGDGQGEGWNPWPGNNGGPPIPVTPPSSGNQPPGTSPPPSGGDPPIVITPPTGPGEPPLIVVPPTQPPGPIGGEIVIPLPGGGSTTVPVVIIVVPPPGKYWDGDSYENEPPAGQRHCCEDGYIYDAALRACVLPTTNAFPLAPAAPIFVSKSCSGSSVTIKTPAWLGHPPILEMELWHIPAIGAHRRIGSFANNTANLIDVAAHSPNSYEYRARARNVNGWGPLGAPLTVSLISSTATVNITEPQTGATGLHGMVILEGTVVDAGGAKQVHFQWQERPISSAQLVWPGTNKNGKWRLSWDTKRAIQGTGKVRLLAKGSDDCWAYDEVELTLANTPANSIQTFDIGPLQIVEEELLFRDVYVGVELPALSPATRDQYMTLCGLRAWNIGESDPMASPPNTSAEAQTQFDAHQRVALPRKVTATSNALRKERRVYSALPKLTPAKQIVVARFQLHERELFIPYKIGPSTQLVKARESKDAGKTIVFGRGTAALMEFNGTSYTLVKDLADMGAGDAFDAAMVDDKVYFLRPNSRSVWVYDKTQSERPWTFQIRDTDGEIEPRLPTLIERVGDSLVVFCVDEELTPATNVYKVTGDDIAFLWDVDGAASHSDVATTGVLAVSAGAELWRSDTQLGAPQLMNTFNADITTLDQFRVGTVGGGVWAWNGNSWVQELTTEASGSPAPVAAVGAWNGASEVLRGVAAASGAVQLYEQDNDGSWSGGRIVINPAGGPETVSQVLAVRRYLVTKGNAAPGQEVEIEDERLLILTGDDGLLLTLSVSTLSESNGAFPMSALGVAQLASGGSKEVKPIEASGTP